MKLRYLAGFLLAFFCSLGLHAQSEFMVHGTVNAWDEAIDSVSIGVFSKGKRIQTIYATQKEGYRVYL